MRPKNESQFRSLLRAFVNTFPPLKLALYINDLICYLFSLIVDGISWLLRNSFKFTLFISGKIFGPVYELVSKGFTKLLSAIPVIRDLTQTRDRDKYERLDKDHGGNKMHQEPIPYSNQLIKRSITYHGGLLLALFLYIFIYFVLVKHHTYTTVSIAFILLLVYMLLIENSHNIRSILMLCLPIMFTNRGRALVFCSMLTLLSHGPIRSLQHNVKEIHTSLNCCKQYLLVRTDKYVGDRVVNKLVRVEEVVLELMNNIKQFAQELKQKLDVIIGLAVTTEEMVMRTLHKLKEIINVCNSHTAEMYISCVANVNKLFIECRSIFNPFGFNLCSALSRLKGVCNTVKIPDVLCELPQQVVDFFERTIGRKLAEYMRVIEKELYVDIDVNRQFDYNVTKSKSYSKVAQEIKFDVDQKFWYLHLVRRIFNLLSLILVVWIFSTATIYHMHYLGEVHYDNMYLDERLNEIEDLRKMGALKLKEKPQANDNDALEQPTVRSVDSHGGAGSRDLNNNNENPFDYNDNLMTVRSAESPPLLQEENRLLVDEFDPLGARVDPEPALPSINEDAPPVERQDEISPTEKEQQTNLQEPDTYVEPTRFLFPMKPAHEQHYLRPFSWRMNSTEMSKVYWSGLVWLVIIGYIGFFLLVDFAFYQLVHFLVETLREILFTSDLPLVDVQTKTRNANGETNVVKYNRTYLASLRKKSQAAIQLAPPTNGSLAVVIEEHKQNQSLSSVRSFYDRLMVSIERDIPDDVAILESLEECLPAPEEPAYSTYKMLGYLALFTFGAVIVEAYALRTRHCIANLYYPRRARQRALWLYRKLLAEKPKFDEMPIDDASGGGGGGGGHKQISVSMKPQYGQSETERRRERRGQIRRQAMDIGFKLLNDRVKR